MTQTKKEKHSSSQGSYVERWKETHGQGPALARGRRYGLISHYRDERDDREGQGKGSAPAGGEDHRNRE